MARCCSFQLCGLIVLALCCQLDALSLMSGMQHLLRGLGLKRHGVDTRDAESNRVKHLPGWGRVDDSLYSG